MKRNCRAVERKYPHKARIVAVPRIAFPWNMQQRALATAFEDASGTLWHAAWLLRQVDHSSPLLGKTHLWPPNGR
jgi:hypothetical protein